MIEVLHAYFTLKTVFHVLWYHSIALFTLFYCLFLDILRSSDSWIEKYCEQKEYIQEN